MNSEQNFNNHQRKSHHNRPDLIGEHKLGDMGQLILLVIFLAIWVLDSFVLEFSILREGNVPWYFRYPPAAAILVFAGYMSWSGLRTVFGKVREQPQVISHGIFSIVRHPIYLGSILTYLGLIISTLSVLSFLFWIIIVIFYYLISRYEEQLLVNHFGKDYEEYRQKVPMLFPLRFR